MSSRIAVEFGRTTRAAIKALGAATLVFFATVSGCRDSQDQQTVVSEQQAEACAMLDDPQIRPLMSAALEIKLAMLCGRLTPGQPPAAPRVQTPSGETTLRFQLRGEQLGGTDVPVSNPALDTGGSTQSETSVVAVGQTVCAAWNDAGEGFGTNGFSGFGFSLDGGTTFTDGGAFPNGPSDTNRGDPSLAYSARDNTFYYVAISTRGLSLWRSANNCQTFQYVGALHLGAGDDKELMAIDNTPSSPFYGRIHVGWTNFSLGTDRNQTTFSDDGGLTWSAAATLPGSGINGQGMYPGVAPNGDVYMALLNRAGAVGGAQDQWIYKSTNGGVSWAKGTNIASGQLRPENTISTSSCGRQALKANVRNLSSPQIVIGVDASAPAGYVIHSVYPYDSDGTGLDESNVFYRRSVDGAQTWSAEVKLNDDATNSDQFFPAIGVSETGVLVASWYDRRLDANNIQFDRFVTISADKGLTWSPNERVSDVSSPVAQTNPNFDGLATCYHGDYDQVAVSGSAAHLIWSDDRRATATGPNPDIYYDRIVLGPAVTVSPSVFEGGASPTGTVVLGAPAPAGGASVSLTSSVPSLVMVPVTVVVPAGAQSATFAVTSIQTTTETAVTVVATFPDATVASRTVTVLASPTVSSLALAPTSVIGGNSSTGTVTLTGPAPAGGATVVLSSSNTAVATVPATVMIPAGMSTATFAVTTLVQSANTSVSIAASFHNTTASAVLTVARAVSLVSVAVNPSTLEGGGTATGTLTLNDPAPAGGAVVTLSSSDPSVAQVPAMATVPAGLLTTTFSITTVSISTQTPVTISGTFPASITRTATLTVLASPTATALTLNPTTVVGGSPSTGTVTLSTPAPAGGSIITLTSSNTAVATVPPSFTVPQGAQSGTFTVTTLATTVNLSVTISASVNGVTRSATLAVTRTLPVGNAVFDVGLQAPRCTTVDSFCDTGGLVDGRDTMSGGAEPNQPNTINDSCADGTSGTFHSDESLDRLRISTLDGTPLAAGKVVRIEATVWAFSTTNRLDLFFAPDAASPVWSTITTTPLQPPSSGQQLLSTTFTLPAATLPAIRANWRFSSTAGVCTVGGFDDRDDLIFALQTGADTTPPTAVITAPANATSVRGTVTVNVDASDNVGVTLVTLLVDGVAQGTDATAPYSFALDTTPLLAGGHQLEARASDAAGNVGTSTAVTIVVDNSPPTVTITSPVANATVSGNVTVSATADDVTTGVASVEFLVDGVLFATDTTSPYSVVWDTSTVPPGSHTLTARATDVVGNQGLSAGVPVTVTAVNQAPVVSAGPDRVIAQPAAATLSGTVTDDGLPAPPALTITWTRTSGPGTVTFANASAAATTATFSATGVYVLRLTASDGALSAFDEMQVTVNAANQAPVVSAGPDRVITQPAAATLSGTATDDGLPAPPALTITWTQTSGPGTTTFANASAAATTATFSATGVYVLRLTASDGALSAFDEMQVTVNAANQAPVVSAGPDRVITQPAAATLSGTATDDGLPAPPALTITWTRTSGPGTVTFANASAAATTATFSATGVYVLRLTASDGALSAFDEMQVTVNAANQAPVVSAGPDRVVTQPAAATLSGTVTDDGLPAPPALTITWTRTSGPGTVTFANASAAATTATFSATGVHVLRLTASDGALSTFDEMQVTVNAANQAPVVSAGPDRVITQPAAATLSGTVTDDGLPAPPALTITWTRTSGPGTVTFANASAAATTATFSATGVHVLRLTASDGALSAFDEMQVTVNGGTATPCTGLCSNPVNFTISGSFQSGNLGTGAICYQTTSVIHGGNCGNFVSPRTLSVNGTQEPCTGANWASVPAARNGGYCIQTTTGNQPWAYFTNW